VLHIAPERGGVPPSSIRSWIIAVSAVLVAALLLSALLAVLSGLILAVPVLAQEATPGILPPTDPRSEGQGPGIDGGPLLAALVVVALGVLAALATLAYARLIRR
jgi:hypothetical protein